MSLQSPLRALTLAQPVDVAFFHPCFVQPLCFQTMWTFPQPKLSAGWEQPLLGLCSAAGMGCLIVSLRTMATLCSQEEGFMKGAFLGGGDAWELCGTAACVRWTTVSSCLEWVFPGSEWTPCEHGTPGSVGCQRKASLGVGCQNGICPDSST